jgi:lactoylglutathione lyase
METESKRKSIGEPMEIDYIALFVEDVERAVAFYRDLLGFEFPKPIKHNGCEGKSGRLKIGLYHRSWLPQLLGREAADLEAESKALPHRFLLSISVNDLDRIYTHLQAAQVEILQPPQVMPWGQRLFFFKDPEGNLLELVERTELAG